MMSPSNENWCTEKCCTMSQSTVGHYVALWSIIFLMEEKASTGIRNVFPQLLGDQRYHSLLIFMHGWPKKIAKLPSSSRHVYIMTEVLLLSKKWSQRNFASERLVPLSLELVSSHLSYDFAIWSPSFGKPSGILSGFHWCGTEWDSSCVILKESSDRFVVIWNYDMILYNLHKAKILDQFWNLVCRTMANHMQGPLCNPCWHHLRKEFPAFPNVQQWLH